MSSGVPPQVDVPQINSNSFKEGAASTGGFRQWMIRAFRFLGEVKQEFWRINWTNPQELRTSTKVVLGGMLLAGFVIYGVDLILQGMLSLLNTLSVWIAG